MQIIYEPKGKAREYAPLAANLYTGCPHGCRYCYGPTIPNPAKKGLTMEQWREQWHARTLPRENMLARFGADCRRMYRNSDTRPVLLCFACDPYPPDEPNQGNGGMMHTTRAALTLMKMNGVTPIILTKGGTRACRDFDILKAAGGWFGQTMSLAAHQMPHWEPNAAPAEDRRHAWFDAKQAGIKTWISVEPVLDATGALAIIDRFIAIGTIDHWKFGKLSGYDAETRAFGRSIDWRAYREEARRVLNDVGYQEITEPGAFEVGTYYVKRELRESL